MQKKLTLYLALIFGFLGVTFVLFKGYARLDNRSIDQSYTIFSYDNKKLEKLESVTSTNTITEERLKEEDRFVSDVLTQKEAPFLDKMRFFTYLYSAQREFAFLSFSLKNHFEGDLHFLSVKILNLFYPDYSATIDHQDAYSQQLTNIVLEPIVKRFEKEKTLKNEYLKDQWIPWAATPSSQFFPAEFNWKQLSSEIDEVLKIQKKATTLEKQKALYWMGGFGSESGDWIEIGNLHLFDEKHNLPLGKILLIRNLLTVTLYDAEIASYQAKHHYGVKRPFTINKTIIPIGSIPASPSYPSSHAAIAGGATELLTHFLPEEKATFIKIRDEACYSRLIAGVHTQIDLTEGKKMGEKIAHEVLFKEWDHKETSSSSKEQFFRLAVGRYNLRPKCYSRKALLQRHP